MVWLTLKTLMFPLVGITLVWFVWRVSRLDRKPNVLEQYVVYVTSSLRTIHLNNDFISALAPEAE